MWCYIGTIGLSCSRVVDLCKQKTQSASPDSECEQVALIEVPQSEQERQKAVGDAYRFTVGMLDKAKGWIVSTPVVLSLDQGIVVQVYDVGEGEEPSAISTLSQSQSSAAPQRLEFEDTLYNRTYSETGCGPLSLLAVLDSMGVKATPEERNNILHANTGIGTSMLRLKELAEEQGLHTLGVEISLATLKRLGLHSIVLINDIGFAAVTGYTDDGIQLVFPLKPPRVVADASFERLFGKPGKGLLLSTQPLLPSDLGIGPATPSILRLSRNVLAVGRVYRPIWEGDIVLFNDGGRTLQIGNVESSCSCVTASVSQQVLRPGESATLKAKGTQSNIGPFRYDIVMTTDLEDNPIIKVPIRGIYSPPVFFEKAAVMVRDILHGQAKDIDVPLYVAEGGPLRHVAFVIPNDVSIQVKAVRATSGAPIARIHWNGNMQPGLHRFDIGVKMNDEVASPPQHRLSFAVQVLPVVDVSPPSFYVRDSEVSSKWWRHADIHVNADVGDNKASTEKRWLFSWSDQRFAEAVHVKLSAEDAKRASIRLSPASMEHVIAVAGQQATLEVRAAEQYAARIHIYIGRNSFFQTTAWTRAVDPNGWLRAIFDKPFWSLCDSTSNVFPFSRSYERSDGDEKGQSCRWVVAWCRWDGWGGSSWNQDFHRN